MMAPASMEWLQAPEVAFEGFLAVHRDDKPTCERIGVVPRRLYADPQEDYIELGMGIAQAVERAVQFFVSHCGLTRKSLFVLRVQFTPQDFAKHAAKRRQW